MREDVMYTHEYIRDRYYDSRLYTARVSETRNADLILIVRVHLRRHDPPGDEGTITDVAGNTVKIVKWESHAQWQLWRQSLKHVVEQTWNNKLWLVPRARNFWLTYTGDSPFSRCDPYDAFVPNVKCGLRLMLVGEENAHLRIRCVRLAPGEFHTSAMNRRAGIGYLDHQDVNLETKNAAEGHQQIPAAHELGHFLGLSHVACDDNSMVCYGTTPHQRGDIMGQGSRVEAWHAWPWLQRIRQHLHPPPGEAPLRWRATATRPAPRSYRVYPSVCTDTMLDGGLPPGGV
jgi:hypothetical protein